MGLVKRNNVWWMSLTYQGKQVRRSTGTSNKRLAENILSSVKVKIVEGRFFDTLQEKERTFGEMMERYLKECAITKAPTSYVRDQNCLQHLLPCFGTKTLAAITPQALAGYKVTRRQELAASATINKELALMRHAFNVASREWEWCRDNPVRRVSMEKVNNKRDRWLTNEEEARLLKACSVWLCEILTFALHTGMRMGEILSLTWEGVDLFRKTVTVFRSKNGERRTIPINQTMLDLLKSKAKVRPLRTNLVFCSQTLTPLDGSHLRRAFRAALETVHLADFRFHDLRHTFATRLVQAGIDLYKVQRLLGHKSGLMTQRYAHHWPESLRDGVEILDRSGSFSTNLAQCQEVGVGAEA